MANNVTRRILINRAKRAALGTVDLTTVPELQQGQLSPLGYLLKRINDETVPTDIRDRLAIMAAPYCHPKLVERHQGKKARAEKAATMAGVGTPWGTDLEFENRTQ